MWVHVQYEGDHGAQQSEWKSIREVNGITWDVARDMEAEKYGETLAQKRRRMGGAKGVRWLRYVRLSVAAGKPVGEVEPQEVNEGKRRQRVSPRLAGAVPVEPTEAPRRGKRRASERVEDPLRGGGGWTEALAAAEAVEGRRAEAPAASGGVRVAARTRSAAGGAKAAASVGGKRQREAAGEASESRAKARRFSQRLQGDVGGEGLAAPQRQGPSRPRTRARARLVGWEVEDAPV